MSHLSIKGCCGLPNTTDSRKKVFKYRRKTRTVDVDREAMFGTRVAQLAEDVEQAGVSATYLLVVSAPPPEGGQVHHGGWNAQHFHQGFHMVTAEALRRKLSPCFTAPW